MCWCGMGLVCIAKGPFRLAFPQSALEDPQGALQGCFRRGCIAECDLVEWEPSRGFAGVGAGGGTGWCAAALASRRCVVDVALLCVHRATLAKCGGCFVPRRT